MHDDRAIGPLAGVRVLDLTSNVMGPYASLLLADMGADVWKVEPATGDTMRAVGPSRHPGMASTFLHLNRNKRSIVADLKHPAAKKALERMIEDADVLLYSMRPQAMTGLGLGYAAVRALNPSIVYCGAVGFGQAGPYAERPAYDDLIQAAVGVPALQSRRSGPPENVALVVADRTVGIATAMSVVAALYRRAITGSGQEVQVPMLETFAQFVLGDHLWGHTFDPPLGDWGYARTMNAKRRPYRTSDGRHIAVNLYLDKHWRAFFAASGRPELADDPRFADVHARAEHLDLLLDDLAATFETRTADEWMRLLTEADLPVALMNTPATVVDDPHLRATGFLRIDEHPSEGRVVSVGIPQSWSETPAEIRRPAPRLGENTVELLAEAGFDTDEIDALLASEAFWDETNAQDEEDRERVDD
ncbi:CaiB/BaiF CoA transferase family protein [Microbacterium sp. No. 7]|uniref:CaiB/BaiF CoA transferase family protein n=1 Tax=Microbacterium sp. No. 7 TaxID=1714373 RepID=UPI0006D27735|nr:CoA transferase [Microbacterium sp. No. 7]ALJ21011.1 acetyl-CoA acetyltransferase [Microbacterium sp. No. 7]